MNSISYEKYVELRCEDKTGNLAKLSKLKKENPEESSVYSAAFDMAFDRLVKSHNRGICNSGKLEINKKTILACTEGIKYPSLTFEESKKRINK